MASTPASGRIDFPVDGLPDAVVTRIARFSPKKIPPAVEAEIGGLRRQVVARARPATVRRAVLMSSSFTQLAWWAQRTGVPLVVDELLYPDTVDRFIVEGLAHLTKGSQATYRSQLRRLGEVVLGPPEYPGVATPMRGSDPTRPYSPDEMADLVGWARNLSTERQSAGVLALIALARGAGLKTSELNVVVAADVLRDADGLSVAVREKRPRSVPVQRQWEWAIERTLASAGDGLLFQAHRTKPTDKHVSRFVEHLPVCDDVPKLSTRRLRATWIVDQLDRCVPQNVLAEAAGVEALQIAKYTLHMRSVSWSETGRLLRDGHA